MGRNSRMNFNPTVYMQGNAAKRFSERIPEKINRLVHVYEVIRIIAGNPVFFEEHFGRLARSAAHIGVHCHFDPNEMFCRLKKLISLTGRENGNIKIALTLPGKQDDLYMFYIPHRYPSRHDYQQGVTLLTMTGERDNPNAKISNPELRSRADRQIALHGVWEVLLVNHKGYVTEGSRSNIFFIGNNKVITPEINQVLPGITRNTVIDICRKNKIPIRETSVKLSNIPGFVSAFLTGTSSGVLPVKSIDNIVFEVNNPLAHLIMEKYDRRTEAYLAGLNYICNDV